MGGENAYRQTVPGLGLGSPPRRREKRPAFSMMDSVSGSPPRGRGKAGENHLVAQLPGITPAWAGKRLSAAAFAFASWDHPRVGGEKRYHKTRYPIKKGSPPRGRGKGGSGAGPRPHWGITPAWAGKSPTRELLLIVSRDHPRVGGEKHTEQRATAHAWGSPPRGRGKV